MESAKTPEYITHDYAYQVIDAYRHFKRTLPEQNSSREEYLVEVLSPVMGDDIQVSLLEKYQPIEVHSLENTIYFDDYSLNIYVQVEHFYRFAVLEIALKDTSNQDKVVHEIQYDRMVLDQIVDASDEEYESTKDYVFNEKLPRWYG